VFVGDRVIKVHALIYIILYDTKMKIMITLFCEELFAYVVVFVSGVIIFPVKLWGMCL
jgi:hypothetical protein